MSLTARRAGLASNSVFATLATHALGEPKTGALPLPQLLVPLRRRPNPCRWQQLRILRLFPAPRLLLSTVEPGSLQHLHCCRNPRTIGRTLHDDYKCAEQPRRPRRPRRRRPWPLRAPLAQRPRGRWTMRLTTR